MLFYSKVNHHDLRDWHGINLIAYLFELIGIYQEYDANMQMDFNAYYLTKRITKDHHYRNIGERIIKGTRNCRNIPRWLFRYLSQTWYKVPVITSSDADVLLKETLEYVLTNEVLSETFRVHILADRDGLGIKRNRAEELLAFVYVLIQRTAENGGVKGEGARLLETSIDTLLSKG